MASRCKPPWENIEDARADFRAAYQGWRSRVQSVPCKSFCELARTCVASNTYRAFRNVVKPSRLFRGWAFTFLQSGRFFQLAANPERFDGEHACVVRELCEYWQCVAEKDIQYGRAVKLLNLLVRDACESYLIGDEYERIVNRIHVPLDEYVLTATSPFFQADLERAGCPLREGPLSMGAVQNEKQYRVIQDSIRSLTKAANAPPIIVDYLAWVRQHKNRQVEP